VSPFLYNAKLALNWNLYVAKFNTGPIAVPNRYKLGLMMISITSGSGVFGGSCFSRAVNSGNVLVKTHCHFWLDDASGGSPGTNTNNKVILIEHDAPTDQTNLDVTVFFQM